MTGRFASAIFLAAVLLHGLAAPLPLAAQTARFDWHGQCRYSDQVLRYRQETTLIQCDVATLRSDGTETTLDFTQRGWDANTRFSGTLIGDTLTVTRLTLRNAAPVAATGKCELYRRRDGSGLSLISCLVTAGPSARSVAANFVPSRL